MKQVTIGTFATREEAERAIDRLHNDLGIATDEISYAYRNPEGEVTEVDAEDVASKTPSEGATDGAKVGGAVGAIAGLAAVAGVIPAIGPIFAAGPLAAALGLTGAIGTTAAGAATGAAAGGVIGALMAWGVSEEKAQTYADQVEAGSVLVAVHAEDDKDVLAVMSEEGATDADVYALAL